MVTYKLVYKNSRKEVLPGDTLHFENAPWGEKYIYESIAPRSHLVYCNRFRTTFAFHPETFGCEVIEYVSE